MDIKKIDHLFAETAYVRMGGSSEEFRAAEYIKNINEQVRIIEGKNKEEIQEEAQEEIQEETQTEE